MAFIEWSAQCEVGIEKVDDQHKRLFEMLNDLHQATIDGAEQSTLARILDDMVEYTVYHFETEETLFLEYSYPGYDEHKKAHDDLTAQAVALQKQFRDGSATISFEVLEFLHGWLMDHTTGLDQEMVPFFEGKGVH